MANQIHKRTALIDVDELNALADRALARMVAPLAEAADAMLARMVAPLIAPAAAMEDRLFAGLAAAFRELPEPAGLKHLNATMKFGQRGAR